ncbi:gamma-glutamyl-phosphate reductase [Chamaesiphon sp. VAR_48_metabat_135_sub]|uniref:glutamate-5-semialdehyde dehydrogenase n=1 Tax=Chamaesiphon sp. VAR_48_metabat_135_sub TaxID=2964699 RepID=UPI00286C6BDB|nr:gamma-glutamyl-phosphate reductase [Chamaesiphon sp. VAR_48_metabat_135_sub]
MVVLTIITISLTVDRPMEHASANPSLASVLCQSVRAGRHLSLTNCKQREQAIESMATALRGAFHDILEANTLDLEASRELGISDLLLEWLKLTPERLQRYIDLLHRLGELSSTNGNTDLGPQTSDRQRYSQVKPLGTVAFIYEALPELGAIAAGMSIKTGNSIILRGGTEAQHTNRAIEIALRTGLEQAEFPQNAVQLIDPDPSLLYELLTHTQQVNLAICYGRPSLIHQVTQQATVSILPGAIGNCYLYWGANGDMELVRHAICDSHVGEPDAVNAIEKVLIHTDRGSTSLTMLWKSLKDKGFQLRGDRELVANYGEYLQLAQDGEWHHPYLRKIIAFKSVKGVDEAIATIDRFSSGHADCIVTDSYLETQQFVAGINSACVYINASPRFYRHQRGSDRIWLGMSNYHGSQRGAIGLSALMTTQQVTMG